MSSNTLPMPGQFRLWLSESLKRLSLSPYSLAREMKCGRNSIAAFLDSASQDIRLGTARDIQRAVMARAAAADIELPAIEAAADGS